MSRQTEKAMKAAMKYLSEHATGNESEEEMNKLLMKFMNEYNIQEKKYEINFT